MKASFNSHRPLGLTASVKALAVSALTVALLALPAAAMAADQVELKTASFKDVTKTGPDGKKVVVREPISKAAPGTEIIYVITYHNTSAGDVADVKVQNGVPKGLIFKVGSAEGAGTNIDYSVDGGQHFGALDTLKVTAPDGTTHLARGEDVTTIRWTLSAPLKGAAEGSVSYRALLP